MILLVKSRKRKRRQQNKPEKKDKKDRDDHTEKKRHLFHAVFFLSVFCRLTFVRVCVRVVDACVCVCVRARLCVFRRMLFTFISLVFREGVLTKKQA